jgi:hypothetical protein
MFHFLRNSSSLNNSIISKVSPNYTTLISDIPTNIEKGEIKLNDQAIANEFICSICRAIPLDPVKCSKCNIIFCKQELTDWFKKSTFCPMRCSFQNSPSALTAFGNLSHTEKNILNQININCKCEATGLTFNNIKTHLTACKAYISYSCSDCKVAKRTLDEMVKHANTDCPVLFETCEYCKSSIRKSEKVGHLEACAEKCMSCNNKIARIKFNEHKLNNECAGFIKQNYEKLLKEEKDKILKAKAATDELEKQIKEEKDKNQRLKAQLEECEKAKKEYTTYPEQIRKLQNDYNNLTKNIANMNNLIDNKIKSSEELYKEFLSKNDDGEGKKSNFGKYLFLIMLILVIVMVHPKYFALKQSNRY